MGGLCPWVRKWGENNMPAFKLDTEKYNNLSVSDMDFFYLANSIFP